MPDTRRDRHTQRKKQKEKDEDNGYRDRQKLKPKDSQVERYMCLESYYSSSR